MPITRHDAPDIAADRPARRAESVAAAVERLVDAFHAATPPRVWSLIVTFFGDAIVPRGGEVWTGTVAELLQAVRIDDRAVRAAMSRLARDGWFAREKVGRLSFYSLTPSAKREFAAASDRIYGAPASADGAHWRLVILPAGEGRAARRDRLLKAGYGQIAPGVLVGPSHLSVPDEAEQTAMTVLAAALEAGDPGALVESAFDLAPLARRYRSFVERFAPLQDAVPSGTPLDGLTALVARTLLIHDYRRIVLRDPGLPSPLLPSDWPGHDARRLCAALYRRLTGPSDDWLERHGRCRDGALPAPIASYDDRFSAH